MGNGDSNGSNNRTINNIVFNCENLKTIGQWCFQYTALTKVTLPDTVETIGQKAFNNCSNLTCMILPSGKLTLGENSINFNIQKSITIFKTTKVSDLTIDKAPATNHPNWYYVFPYLTKSEVESVEWYSKISGITSNIYYKDTLTTDNVSAIINAIGSSNVSNEAKEILNTAAAKNTTSNPSGAALALFNPAFITKQQFLF